MRLPKQLRIRDIGGIIIIDFIDMNDQCIKDGYGGVKNALKKDRTKTSVVGMTGLGLIEMTRKKSVVIYLRYLMMNVHIATVQEKRYLDALWKL